ncbi:MAG: hypothetical protein R3D66_04535 [Alphaproteobacteria bacterium]
MKKSFRNSSRGNDSSVTPFAAKELRQFKDDLWDYTNKARLLFARTIEGCPSDKLLQNLSDFTDFIEQSLRGCVQKAADKKTFLTVSEALLFQRRIQDIELLGHEAALETGEQTYKLWKHMAASKLLGNVRAHVIKGIVAEEYFLPWFAAADSISKNQLHLLHLKSHYKRLEYESWLMDMRQYALHGAEKTLQGLDKSLMAYEIINTSMSHINAVAEYLNSSGAPLSAYEALGVAEFFADLRCNVEGIKDAKPGAPAYEHYSALLADSNARYRMTEEETLFTLVSHVQREQITSFVHMFDTLEAPGWDRAFKSEIVYHAINTSLPTKDPLRYMAEKLER